MRLFADSIRYEDFNYLEPFVGKPAVLEFVTAFDIPNVEFVPLKISDGDRAVCFTWKVVVNGQDGPSGISFYEVDGDGKVCFIRDIPIAVAARLPAGGRERGGGRPRAAHAERGEADEHPALGVGSMGMALLKPIFHKEAELQAELLGGDDARAEAVKRLDEEAASAPVVVYTYALRRFRPSASPFSTRSPGCSTRRLSWGSSGSCWVGRGRACAPSRWRATARAARLCGREERRRAVLGENSRALVGLVELKRQGRLEGMLKEAGAS